MSDPDNSSRVAILLATRDGAKYLPAQLRSLLDQTHPHIDIWASDDGSTDGTRELLRDWRALWGKGEIHVLSGPQQGFAENFRGLLSAASVEADHYAFCDQDDVWEPDKLERALAWMRTENPQKPLLFCSRTRTITERGEPQGCSPLFERKPSFRNALVQSIAGGNTMVMNRAARDLIAAASVGTSFVSHDWWSYLIVSGAGGEVYYCAEPLVRYRQHEGNQVGANVSWLARLSRLKRLFEGQFKIWTDANMAGLADNRHLLTPDAIAARDLFLRSRRGAVWRRIADLRASGVYRQTWLGQAGLYLAVCIGRI